MAYTLRQICDELQATAEGKAYYGNALYVARDIPGVTDDERNMLSRWLDGSQVGRDRMRLQDMVVRLLADEQPVSPYGYSDQRKLVDEAPEYLRQMGSFYTALAEAWTLADSSNRMKLGEAFPEHFYK